MLKHIALTVNDPEDIKNFYEEILLFNLQKKSTVNGDITAKIFNINSTADVYMMGHQDVEFEIFISPRKEKKVFTHVCLAYWKAEMTYKKALEMGYKAIIKENLDSDSYFLWDNSGNIFEIKEIQETWQDLADITKGEEDLKNKGQIMRKKPAFVPYVVIQPFIFPENHVAL